MQRLSVKTCVLGPVFTNCYLGINRETGEAFVVDPGDNAPAVIRKLKENNAVLTGILLTHGHFDHIMAVNDLLAEYNVPVYASEAENETLLRPEINMTGQFGRACSIKADKLLKDLETFQIAGLDVQMIATPGHTKGSCCYYLKEEGVLFSGDTLFHGSVGRTDFPGGSTREIIDSLHRLLDSLPEDTEVFPGHESSTTIGFEKRYNPFV